MIKTYPILRPLAWLYGLVVAYRNKLYSNGRRTSKKFDIPIICVGNITAGGTGKTPHTEYLIRLLSPQYKVVVLSRGYKRKSKGFQVVEVDSTAESVGDEPLQIKQKYPDTLVVVDKNRISAIEKILSGEKENRPDVILLDDGFQYRQLQPSLSLVLINSNRPIFRDKLLPEGLLREPMEELKRCDIAVVTKCRKNIDIANYQWAYEPRLKLPFSQMMVFTTFDYGNIQPVFADLPDLHTCSLTDLANKHVLLVAGIASPQPLINMLSEKTPHLQTQFFPDHHFFTEKDVKSIQKQFNAITSDSKIILTTEKDAVRFRSNPFLDDEMKRKMYYIPIEVGFLDEEQKQMFDNKILHHIQSFYKPLITTKMQI